MTKKNFFEKISAGSRTKFTTAISRIFILRANARRHSGGMLPFYYLLYFFSVFFIGSLFFIKSFLSEPINFTVYELFDCTQWDLQIDVTLKKTTADENQDDKIVLSPRLTNTWMSSVKLTPMVNEPLTALITDKLLTDSTRIAMISDYQERSI